MACKNSCKLCDKLIISQSVTYTGGNVVVNIPAGSYGNGCKYCLVIAQAIPAEALIGSAVVVTIGTDAVTQYPITDCCGRTITAPQISTRTRYSTRVVTTATGGSFRLLNNCIRSNTTALAAIPAPTAG